jgi:transposase
VAVIALDCVDVAETRFLGEPGRARRFDGMQPKTLLAALTYAYGAEIFESAEIEIRARRDNGLCYLLAGVVPRWTTLIRFRRSRREWIEFCLALFLERKRLFERGDNSGSSVSVAGFKADARDRVQRAVEADSAAIDE